MVDSMCNVIFGALAYSGLKSCVVNIQGRPNVDGQYEEWVYVLVTSLQFIICHVQ